jgi:hypothetical protein
MVLIAALVLLAAFPALAEGFRATFYPQGKREPVLYIQTQTEQKNGDTLARVRRVYATPDGKEAAVEEIAFEDGRLKSFRLEHKQAGETGLLELKDGKAHFSYTAEGKTKTATEALSPDFVISPLLVDYLHANWDALAAGRTVKARLAILDRRETVGFQFTKVGETGAAGRPLLVVQMKPSSFIIAALVKPIRMVFDKETRRLVEYSGRVVPKRQVEGKWEPLDADVVYLY